eukprot:tig00021462_g21603.t1
MNTAAALRRVSSAVSRSMVARAPMRTPAAAVITRSASAAAPSGHTAKWLFNPDGNTKSPMELIAEVPPIEINGRVAACDGGGGPLGHPIEYIVLDKPTPNECKYCGLRFIQKKKHGHH